MVNSQLLICFRCDGDWSGITHVIGGELRKSKKKAFHILLFLIWEYVTYQRKQEKKSQKRKADPNKINFIGM